MHLLATVMLIPFTSAHTGATGLDEQLLHCLLRADACCGVMMISPAVAAVPAVASWAVARDAAASAAPTEVSEGASTTSGGVWASASVASATRTTAKTATGPHVVGGEEGESLKGICGHV